MRCPLCPRMLGNEGGRAVVVRRLCGESIPFEARFRRLSNRTTWTKCMKIIHLLGVSDCKEMARGLDAPLL